MQGQGRVHVVIDTFDRTQRGPGLAPGACVRRDGWATRRSRGPPPRCRRRSTRRAASRAGWRWPAPRAPPGPRRSRSRRCTPCRSRVSVAATSAWAAAIASTGSGRLTPRARRLGRVAGAAAFAGLGRVRRSMTSGVICVLPARPLRAGLAGLGRMTASRSASSSTAGFAGAGSVAAACAAFRASAALGCEHNRRAAHPLRRDHLPRSSPASGSPRMRRKPATWTSIDRGYESIRVQMEALFADLGITAAAAKACTTSCRCA